MKLPPLSTLRFFDVAARSGSFVNAAEQLHVTHSAISRQIKLLEEQLGIALFERRNRRVFLTPAGELLFQTTSSIFEQLHSTVKKLKTQTTNDVISISCEPTIAMKWLIPRLTDFYQLYPDITVHLVTAGGPIDFVKTNVDLAFRRNDFKWSDNIHAVKICPEKMGVVHRMDYDTEVFLHSRSRPTAWQRWQEIAKIQVNNLKSINYEHFYLCIQGALAGQGAAIASFLMVADEINSGQLIAPSGFIEDGSAYYLLSSQSIEANSAAEYFTHWLQKQADKSLAMTVK